MMRRFTLAAVTGLFAIMLANAARADVISATDIQSASNPPGYTNPQNVNLLIARQSLSESRIAMEFDISNLSFTDPVGSATLILYEASEDSAVKSFSVNGFNGDGNVDAPSDFTQINQIATFNSNGTTTAPREEIRIDVTQFVKAAVDGLQNFVGFMINRAALGAVGDSYILDSSNGPNNAAQLEVTAVPEPSSLVLCGLGLAGIAAWRSRQRKVGLALSDSQAG